MVTAHHNWTGALPAATGGCSTGPGASGARTALTAARAVRAGVAAPTRSEPSAGAGLRLAPRHRAIVAMLTNIRVSVRLRAEPDRSQMRLRAGREPPRVSRALVCIGRRFRAPARRWRRRVAYEHVQMPSDLGICWM